MIIVSMTTIARRTAQAAIVLRSILAGDLRPDRLVLNISRDPFLLDKGIAEVPAEIAALPVDVAYVRNYGSARKLLPVLLEYCGQDVLLVTADDDVSFPATWLSLLTKSADETPKCVVCYRARKITSLPYRQWKRVKGKDTLPSGDMLPTGCFGIVYRPSFFSPTTVDVDLMLKTAPTADDLWFAATRKADIKARVIRATSKPFERLRCGRQLTRTNYHRGGNDAAIAKLSAAGLWPSRGPS